MLLGGLGAYYKYGDRTELFDRSLRGTESALSELRRQIAAELGSRLRPVFDNPDSVIEMGVLDPFGNPIEVAVSPAGSEDYTNAISDFVNSNFEALIDCRRLIDLRRRWCGCARALSWAIFTFVLIEGFIASALAFWTKYLGHEACVLFLGASFVMTVLFIAVALVGPIAFLLFFHDQITKTRLQYDTP